MLARINSRYIPAYWDDFFNDSFFSGMNRFNRTPSVNIVEGEKEFRIEMAVPGMTRDNFRIDMENDILTILSEKREEKEEKDHRYMRREFGSGTFKRSFRIPETIDQDHIEARYQEGILVISLPKQEEVIQKAARQITIS
jgi:HSP20 family protein